MVGATFTMQITQLGQLFVSISLQTAYNKWFTELEQWFGSNIHYPNSVNDYYACKTI